MKLYTKKGDNGTSSIFGAGKGRIKKNAPVFEVLGTVDELNSILGKVHTSRNKKIKNEVLKVQSDLMVLGSELSGASSKKGTFGWKERTVELEKMIDELEDENPPLKNFILPGGSSLAAELHHARSVARRLDRRTVELFDKERTPDKHILSYVNRLSDLLFVMARYANLKLGVKDIIWKN